MNGWSRHLRWTLLLAAVAIVLFHCWWFSAFTVDDGAISFCYAQNLARGHGLVLVPGGERVEGYTNFLWVLLLALGVRLGVDVVLWSHLTGAALAAGSILGAAELTAALRGRRSPWDAAPALLCALLLPVSYWAMSGLEGGLYTASVVWCAARLVVEKREPARRPLSALCAAAAALTRPDGLSVLAVACALRLLGDRRWRRLAAWYALALVPVALHLLWRWRYYAYPLPNTFYAKVSDPFRWRELLDAGSGGWRYVRGFRERYRLEPLVWTTLLVLYPAPWRQLLLRAGLLGLLAVLVLFPVYARGDWMSEGRFLVATLPLGAALLAAGIGGVVERLRRPRLQAALATVAALAVGLWVVPHALELSRARRGVYPVPLARTAEEGKTYHDYAARHRLRDPSLLIGDLGGTTMYSGMRMIDLAGLGDVTVSHWKQEPSVFREYVHRERRPTLLRLNGFWLEDGVQLVPEFADRYVPAKVRSELSVDRAAFLEPAMDTRAPLGRFERAGVELLRVEAHDELALWLLVRRAEAGGPLQLVDGGGRATAVEHPVLERARWRAGEIVIVRLPRPARAPLRLCDGADGACYTVGEGSAGAAPAAWPRATAEALARAEARGELEAAVALRRRLGLGTAPAAERLYRRGRDELAGGDTARAARDFAAAVAAHPAHSWARRRLEELRLEPRRPYHYVLAARLDEALRALRLQPDAAAMARVALLAQAAEEPEAAALAWVTYGLAPAETAARQALAEALRRCGLDDAPVAAPATASAPGRPIGDGLELVAATARLDEIGDVVLALSLRRAGAGAGGLRVAGRDVVFERAPARWADGEIVTETVTLPLPAGDGDVRVGSATLRLHVEPFTHDFERRRFDGWTARGAAFADGPARWRHGLPMRASEGLYLAHSGVRGAEARGELVSPPLGAGVDEVCFVLAGSRATGVRIDGPGGAQLLGAGDELPRPGCLEVPAAAQSRIVLFDDGSARGDWLMADDFVCFGDGVPRPCAGAATVMAVQTDR